AVAGSAAGQRIEDDHRARRNLRLIFCFLLAARGVDALPLGARTAVGSIAGRRVGWRAPVQLTGEGGCDMLVRAPSCANPALGEGVARVYRKASGGRGRNLAGSAVSHCIRDNPLSSA